MFKVIAKYQRPNYKWETTTTGPFIMKEEADKMHKKQSYIAHELMAENKIIDYLIVTIETFKAS